MDANESLDAFRQEASRLEREMASALEELERTRTMEFVVSREDLEEQLNISTISAFVPSHALRG